VEVFVAQLISGLAIGSIYALVLMGLNLLLLVRGIVQFSYPHIVVLSMYVAWLVLGATADNLAWVSIPAAILVAILLSCLTEPIFRSLATRGHFLESIVAAIGISIVMTEIMSHFLHHGQAISFAGTFIGEKAFISYGLIAFSVANIYTLAACIVIMIVLLYVLFHSKQGRAFRAMAQDVYVARLLGIPLTKTSIYSFGVAGALGGITAVLLSMTLGTASPSLGDRLMFISLALLMFAGMGNLKGGLIAGLLFGLATSMSIAYVPGRWSEAIIFGLIMMVIIVRPNGLFGGLVTFRF
jgi:branched-chain amino acid transport system permease protein